MKNLIKVSYVYTSNYQWHTVNTYYNDEAKALLYYNSLQHAVGVYSVVLSYIGNDINTYARALLSGKNDSWQIKLTANEGRAIKTECEKIGKPTFWLYRCLNSGKSMFFKKTTSQTEVYFWLMDEKRYGYKHSYYKIVLEL